VLLKLADYEALFPRFSTSIESDISGELWNFKLVISNSMADLNLLAKLNYAHKSTDLNHFLRLLLKIKFHQPRSGTFIIRRN
jgi:hypothetical protein